MAPPRHVFKIVVTGPFAAGKTTFIQTVVEREFLTTSAVTAAAEESSVKGRTTIGMDFGALTLADPEGDVELRVYGTPGQERFRFMWEVLAEGADGFVLVVSGQDDRSWRDALSHHEVMAGLGLPGVVAVNRADPGCLERARAFFDTLGTPVVACSAIDPAEVRQTLVATLVQVLERLEAPEPASGDRHHDVRPLHLSGRPGSTR